MNPVAGTSAGLTPMLQGRVNDKKQQMDIFTAKQNLKDIPEEKDEDEKRKKEDDLKKAQTKKAANTFKGLKGL